MVPYSTWESAVSSVIQLIVAEVSVMPDEATVLIEGGVVSAGATVVVTSLEKLLSTPEVL